MQKQCFLRRLPTVALGIVFLWLLIYLISAPQPIAAAPTAPTATGLHLLGHIGGEITVLHPMTDLLYAGIGADLAILDVSTPSTPTLLGAVTLGGRLLDVEIVGNYALVAGDQLGLHIVDVTIPSAPQIVTSTLILSAPQNIALYQNLAYITYQANGKYGLAILNVADPAAPVVVNARVDGLPFNPVDLQVWQQHLYVAGWSFEAIGLSFQSWGHLQLFDLQNPTTLTSVAHYQTPSGPGEGFIRLVVMNDRVYTLDGDQLRIFRVTQPTALALLGSVSVAGTYLQVAGQAAYVASSWLYPRTGQLSVINVTDPTNPHLLTTIPAVSNIAIQSSVAYLAYRPTGIAVVDLSAQTLLQPRAVYANWTDNGPLAVVGATLYRGASTPLLRVIDMSNPAQPQLRAMYDQPGSRHVQQLLTDGAQLFVVDQATLPVDADGVDIFTLSGPSDLQHRSRYTTTPVFRAAYQADRLYLATYHDLKNEIEVVNVINPESPVRVATVSLSATVDIRTLVMMGKYALLGALDPLPNSTESYPSVHIIDISTPKAPRDVAIYQAISSPLRLAVADQRLYILFYTTDPSCLSGVEIVDIANPAAPVRLGYQCWPYSANDFVVDDHYLYMTQNGVGASDYQVGRLMVVDAAFPQALAEVALDRRIGQMAYLAYANGMIYTSSDSGLFAYQYNPPQVDVVVTETTTLTSAYDRVEYQFTTTTFTTPVTVTHTSRALNGRQVATPLSARNKAFINHAITLADQQPVKPMQPYTLRLHYTDAEIAFIDETTLALYQWIDGQWRRETSSQVDPTTNTITAMPTTLGAWLVAGRPPHQLYLPVISQFSP